MHALPLLLAMACAVALAPALLRALVAGAHTRPNYRLRELPFPLGVLVLAAATLALIPVELVQRFASTELLHPEAVPIALYALGVIGLGLVDDAFGAAAPGRAPARGWRGHAAAALRGELSTGMLKAAGSVGLALFAMSYLKLSDARWLLAAAVLVLATNVFNLLDLRPGRSIKAFVLLGAGLALGAGSARTFWSLGLFCGPALVAGALDLRERGMLGDSGASLVGALAGLWLVLTLSGSGQLVALGLLAAVTVYGELRSISSLIERTPGLRQLDSWGRPS
jgi:UDP-N-acetylmuramyl pentapeptide phosphotransferase/UDP-N-acetylglucosamine-1-phosphate transferase